MRNDLPAQLPRMIMDQIEFNGKILVIGNGSITRAVLPLLSEHIHFNPTQLHVIAKDADSDFVEALGYTFTQLQLTRDNYTTILEDYVTKGDIVINLTAGVSSLDLMKFCSNRKVLYVDTCIEMWPDEIDHNSKTYDERELLLQLQRDLGPGGPTLLSSMGANPGIVSLLTKRLIAAIGSETRNRTEVPTTRTEWAQLAHELGIKVIHINERDTQRTNRHIPPDTFASTWSVEAMIIESIEPAEMSLGSHEKKLPDNAHFSGTNHRDIFFDLSGKDVKVKTWLPHARESFGMVLNHNEPMSLAELYSLRLEEVTYSPTVAFVYHPSDQTMESVKKLTLNNYQNQKGHLMMHDIVDGIDELGVFVMTENYGSYWLGSQLSISVARSINPDSSATSLQVAGGVVAGVCWVMNHTSQGVVEPEDIVEFDYVLDIAEKYWGGYKQAKTDWLPCTGTDFNFTDFRLQ